MATLRMKNFQILQVAAGKQNAGSFYVKADVYDPKNGTAEYGQVTRFGKNFVNTIRACFPATGTYLAEDGTQQAWNGTNQTIPANTTREQMEKAIPATFVRIPNAQYVDVYLGGEYARVYGQPRRDSKGVEHAADDLILDNDGTFKVYDHQRVLTSMEYVWVNATDQYGNLIPNPKFETGESDDEFIQTIKKDEHGVPVMHEAAGWESKPQAENIKQAFMLSVEAAIQKVTNEGKVDLIPHRYRKSGSTTSTPENAPDNQGAAQQQAQAAQGAQGNLNF